MSVQTALDIKAVYMTPSGRICSLVRTTSPQPGRPLEALLRYERSDGTRAMGNGADGFALAAPNWRLLRKVA